jgi:hypothetical protein
MGERPLKEDMKKWIVTVPNFMPLIIRKIYMSGLLKNKLNVNFVTLRDVQDTITEQQTTRKVLLDIVVSLSR